MNIDKLKEANEKLKKFYYDDSKVVIIDFIEASIKAMESGLPDIEVLSEKIHQAYCKYHIEKNGTEYWTKGDYSKLDEATKEYDRRTAKVVLDLMIPHLVERDERIRELENHTIEKFGNSGWGKACEIAQENNILIGKIEQLEADIKQKDEMIKQLENKLNEYQITNSKDETNKLREDIRKEVTQACASVWRNSINGLSAMGSIKNGMYQTVDNIVKSIVNWHAINCNEKEYKIKQLEAEVKRLKGEE